MIENYGILTSSTSALFRSIAHRLPRIPSLERAIKPNKSGNSSGYSHTLNSGNDTADAYEGNRMVSALKGSKRKSAVGLSQLGNSPSPSSVPLSLSLSGASGQKNSTRYGTTCLPKISSSCASFHVCLPACLPACLLEFVT